VRVKFRPFAISTSSRQPDGNRRIVTERLTTVLVVARSLLATRPRETMSTPLIFFDFFYLFYIFILLFFFFFFFLFFTFVISVSSMMHD